MYSSPYFNDMLIVSASIWLLSCSSVWVDASGFFEDCWESGMGVPSLVDTISPIFGFAIATGGGYVWPSAGLNCERVAAWETNLLRVVEIAIFTR